MTTQTIQAAQISSFSSAKKARSFEGVARRTSKMNAPLSSIFEVEGFNARMDSVELDAHIDNMARAFADGSTPETLKVVAIEVDGHSNAFKLVDGHSTFKAILRANEVYGASIQSAEIDVRSMTEAEQRMMVLTSNMQLKLNMVERGKMFNDLIELDGLKQSQVAERLGISQAIVSNCLQAFKMPQAMKDLIANGTMSDSEAFNQYRSELKTGDAAETEAKANAYAEQAKAVSAQMIEQGKRKRVNTKTVAANTATDTDTTTEQATVKAPKVAFSREVKVDVTEAMATVNTALADVEEGAGATIELTAEQVAILRKAGLHF